MKNAVEERYDQILGDAFDRRLEELLAAHQQAHEIQLAAGGASAQTGGGVKEYQTVGPQARHKLKGILQHYAKEPHPFTACVRDNRKRFGPRAEQVCAVVKDLIWNTTKWRGKGNPAGMGPHPYVGAAEPAPEIDAEVLELVDRLGELELWELMSLVDDRDPVVDDEGNKIELADYSAKQRAVLAKKGHALPDGSFPIANTNDLKNAIQSVGRAKNKKRATKHIVKRAKALGATHMLPQGWKDALAKGQSIQYNTPQAAATNPDSGT